MVRIDLKAAKTLDITISLSLLHGRGLIAAPVPSAGY
jgi:hypothetical protein